MKELFSKEIAFGVTPFETIYYDEYNPHFLSEHYERFIRTCNIFKLPFECDFNNFEKFIRGNMGEDKKYGVLKAVYFDGSICCKIRNASYTKEMYRNGLNIRLSKAIRDDKNIFTYVKTFNYGINYIENEKSIKRGYNTCLFLNKKNEICETAYANIFFRKGNEIFTPYLKSGILKGIMRDYIIKHLKGEGYIIKKASISINDIKNFEECFLTNSVMGAFPILSIEGIEFGKRTICDILSNDKLLKRLWNN